MIFSDFNFENELLDSLDSMGFEKPTPIQEQAIPLILQKRDLIACAQTGTGKTAAFLLPVINRIIKERRNSVSTLVIVPTRELAIQIDEALQGFSYFARTSSLAIYGGNNGMSFEQEKKALTQGADIIIATPGRLISHLNMGYVNFKSIQHLILDEADRMLDMGFSEDIAKIVRFLPADRQTLLFSATMPPKIRNLAKQILRNPAQISLSISKPAEGVSQKVYMVQNEQKISLVKKVLKASMASSIIIFSGTKIKVKQLEKELKALRFNVAAIHSDLDQNQRNEVLRAFKNQKLQILVATDIMSRGIDIDSIGLVINYDVPGDAEDYVHRVGRTARAQSTGEAITFVSGMDNHKLMRIEELIGYKITRGSVD